MYSQLYQRWPLVIQYIRRLYIIQGISAEAFIHRPRLQIGNKSAFQEAANTEPKSLLHLFAIFYISDTKGRFEYTVSKIHHHNLGSYMGI